MDENLWRDSQLGPVAKGERRGPSRAQQRLRARHHVGRRLRAWREGQALNQAEVHAQLGLSGNPSRMTQLEGGEVPWSQDDVAAVAGAVGVSSDELLRAAIHAGDPDVEARHERFVVWAAGLPEGEWKSVVADVEARRSQ